MRNSKTIKHPFSHLALNYKIWSRVWRLQSMHETKTEFIIIGGLLSRDFRGNLDRAGIIEQYGHWKWLKASIQKSWVSLHILCSDIAVSFVFSNTTDWRLSWPVLAYYIDSSIIVALPFLKWWLHPPFCEDMRVHCPTQLLIWDWGF